MWALKDLTMEIFWQGTGIVCVLGLLLTAAGVYIAKQPVKEATVRSRTKPLPYRVMLEHRRAKFH